MQQKYTAKYELFDSIEAMLSSAAMSGILKRSVSQVTCEPFDTPHGFSGSEMFYVKADEQRLIMKGLHPRFDWKSIVSDDHRCRSVLVWQYGLLDRIRPHIDHVTLAACHDEEDYALLMYDVSHGLFHGKTVKTEEVHTLLDALAAMHAHYWEDEDLTDSELGLCDIEKLIEINWPKHLERYPHDPKTVEYISQGWEALFELLESDVRDEVQSLMNNPRPLLDVLANYPSTFIHAGYRLGNLALLPETNQVVAFDWQDASYAPATICLTWFTMDGQVFKMHDAATEYYRQQLSTRLGDRFDRELWQPMLEVGCLVEVLRIGCWRAYFAVNHEDEETRHRMKQSVDTFNTIVRNGLKWL